jgi:MtN3 and saliva related transmembrane protein
MTIAKQRSLKVFLGIGGANRIMALQFLDGLGFVASVFTSSSFVPQVWRTWRTRDVSGISLPSYAIITCGLVLWLLYGVLRGDLPIIVANAIMVGLTGAIATMKIVFSKRPVHMRK